MGIELIGNLIKVHSSYRVFWNWMRNVMEYPFIPFILNWNVQWIARSRLEALSTRMVIWRFPPFDCQFVWCRRMFIFNNNNKNTQLMCSKQIFKGWAVWKLHWVCVFVCMCEGCYYSDGTDNDKQMPHNWYEMLFFPEPPYTQLTQNVIQCK